mmetsp:Transcript_8381/g.27858  ORF Transcript_8381/g.27858 Transcript_8381/m.27858 type:complete len:204 (+) Transcript_8381:74-685(+)
MDSCSSSGATAFDMGDLGSVIAVGLTLPVAPFHSQKRSKLILTREFIRMSNMYLRASHTASLISMTVLFAPRPESNRNSSGTPVSLVPSRRLSMTSHSFPTGRAGSWSVPMRPNTNIVLTRDTRASISWQLSREPALIVPCVRSRFSMMRCFRVSKFASGRRCSNSPANGSTMTRESLCSDIASGQIRVSSRARCGSFGSRSR